MVVPGPAVTVNNFRILVQNQSLQETIIPVGTIMGHVYLTESVTAVSLDRSATSDWEANLINFGDLPIPPEWKERLKRKLSQRSSL